MKKVFVILIIVIGISAGFSWLYVFQYYSSVSPTSPNIEQGKIIKENNHGHIFYIDETQRATLWSLMLITFVALPAGGMLLKKS